MKNEQSILTEPSIKSNPHLIPASEPMANSNFEDSKPEQIKILKYVSDVYQPVKLGHQRSQGIGSEQSANFLQPSHKFKRDKPVFKTFGERTQQQDEQNQNSNCFENENDGEAQLIFNYEAKSEVPAKIRAKENGRKQPQNALLLAKKNAEQERRKDELEPAWYNEYQKNMNSVSDCYFLANSQNYEKAGLKITKNKISIGPIGIDMAKILKIKIFPSKLCQECADDLKIESMELSNYRESSSNYKDNLKIQKENAIKLTMVKDEVFNFSQRYPVLLLSEPKESYSPSLMPCPETPSSGLVSRFPLPYLSFSKIILKKLKQLYPTIKSTEWTAPDFPIRSVIKKRHSTPFSKGTTKNFAFIHGKIYKKSQHKAKWEKRYIIINETGLYSYKQEKDEDFSYEISGKSIKYMWTWFTILNVDKEKDRLGYDLEQEKQVEKVGKQITDQLKKSGKLSSKSSDNEATLYKDTQNPYLIVKVKHGFSGQTELAIPICGFDNEINKVKNWLFALYKLMSHYEY